MMLSAWGSRGDIEPMLALAVQLRTQGIEVLMCAPPNPTVESLSGSLGTALAPRSGREQSTWQARFVPTEPPPRGSSDRPGHARNYLDIVSNIGSN